VPFNVWTQEHMDALKHWIAQGKSFAVAADQINREFRTSYSRNAAIGKAQRMGLCQTSYNRRRATDTVRTRKPPAPPRHKPEPIFRAPPRPKREEIELRCAEVEPGNVALLGLERDQCRYPYGDRNFTFCGQAIYPGSSYCEAHLLLCTRDKDHPRAGKEANVVWLTSARKSTIPTAIALSSGDWEQHEAS
jgi:GcrA cell cycle regulator